MLDGLIIKKMRLLHFSLFILCALSFGCKSENFLIVKYGSTTWVAIEPIQCLSNPWERDWLSKDGNEYADYPKDLSQPGLEPEEFEIIKDYYSRQNVLVFDWTTAPKYADVCRACSCPEGHTMYLLVQERDVKRMITFGYRQEDPKRAN